MKPFIILFFALIPSIFVAQPEANYDETKVPKFTVPDPLLTFSGEAITDSDQWEEKRKLEIYQFFEKQIYGKVPAMLDEYSFEVIEEDNNALGGKAQRKQIAVGLKKNNRSLNFNILLYLPKGNENAPVFLGYNFHGNHTVTDDPKVIVTDAWNANDITLNIQNNKATEASRGSRKNRWAIDKILDNGFGLATVYYGEVDPDKNDFSDGLHSLFYREGQTRPKTNEWGSIAAWAFGLSRAMDYLENDTNISKVIVFGHSRLGKAALWAGASDPRFDGVISNNSGCGGAALSKRKYGETIGHINNSFPHWFSESFKKYSNKEEILPVDQHQLLALIAPRPLYVASAAEDEWADPKGEFLSAQYATPVYALYGKKGISKSDSPVVDRPIQETLAYHIRSGKHDVTNYDWDQYISWAQNFVK
ncbi:acetylxylan esterase [Zobellia galactanivorans]|uniref:glucuronyl esterase domain-containing protein n=1 Tax=Zobellia galactanivorans (strain DSM 12802 / CCUG 47099 / CIP 106680 / NCIMB 13871 / Dsij) TaxID=63186 RepID=UPI002090761E|nr:acetylxylan esterase [Zobellia galactanivorans]MDO6810836.1 acetylxylan esterase [Zobellia galactanivorans]